MTRARMPGAQRHCYLTDEAARQQDAAIRAHEAVAEDYTIGALLAWLGVLALAVGAALARILGGVLP